MGTVSLSFRNASRRSGMYFNALEIAHTVRCAAAGSFVPLSAAFLQLHTLIGPHIIEGPKRAQSAVPSQTNCFFCEFRHQARTPCKTVHILSRNIQRYYIYID